MIHSSSTTLSASLLQDIQTTVQWALQEDVGDGDISAALIPPQQTAKATVIVREHAVICGTAWVNEVFHQIDPEVSLHWAVQDGDKVEANQTLFTAHGNARSLLTAERCALNFLQTLSATATLCRQYADLVTGTAVKLLDTRKTIPGLRSAQKYAVTCGGCYNHRLGLFDAYLIKENHIQACGGISQAVQAAKTNQPGKSVEIEVENFDELNRAIEAGADRIMLDNFSVEEIIKAVDLTQKRAELEASGGINQEQLRAIAETGVDYISIGALTKSFQAIDLSMRFSADS